jgi:hypothetical protein
MVDSLDIANGAASNVAMNRRQSRPPKTVAMRAVNVHCPWWVLSSSTSPRGAISSEREIEHLSPGIEELDLDQPIRNGLFLTDQLI